ncbi:unnamed protein product, partial [Allacma fusca]
ADKAVEQTDVELTESDGNSDLPLKRRLRKRRPVTGKNQQDNFRSLHVLDHPGATTSAVICSSSSSERSGPFLEGNYITENLENPFGFLGNLFVSDKSDTRFDLNTVEDQVESENVNACGIFHELVTPMGNDSRTNSLLEDKIESLTLEFRSIV